jgi:serine phosphatase RsbU (regulator of sigma subunit)
MEGDLSPDILKQRLMTELRRDIPPAVEGRLDDLIKAVLDYHEKEGEAEPLAFDFRSLSGESLLPSREESFGVADFLRLSQVFERSMVGLILTSDLSRDEKSQFIGDIQEFFDSFDTVLLGQLEEELVERGLVRKTPTLETIWRTLETFGFSRDLADGLSDPVLLALDDEIIYANHSAESFFGVDLLGKPLFGAGGIIGKPERILGAEGEWLHSTARILTSAGKAEGLQVLWRTAYSTEGEAMLVVLPGAEKSRTSEERVDDLTRESRRFQLLYRLSRELSHGYDIENLFERLANELSEIMGYNVLLLHIHNPIRGRALFHLAVPISNVLLDTLWWNAHSTLSNFVFGIEDIEIDRRVINPELVIEEPSESKQAVEKAPYKSQLTGSLFILPLVFEDEMFGSLGLHFPDERPPSDEDLRLFSTFTNHLALALKNMVALEGMRKLLRDNKEQIDLARRVQSGLLPKPEAFKRLKFRTLFRPAAGLSGDFYQFFAHPDIEGLVIGDASGHGISASLIMAVAGATFRDACSVEFCDPSDVLLKANVSLKEALGDDFFVTALVFGMNPETLQAIYASAGQAGPLLIKPDGKIRQLTASGIPLGMFDAPQPYNIRRAKLNKGDRLLFFTDGAIESRNIDGEMYGIKSLRACIKQNERLRNDKLLQAIADDISTFLEDSTTADDMTLILVEVI